MTLKKIDKSEEKTLKSVFTYSVNMIVSVFAENESKARLALDDNGGYVSHRTVELMDAVQIYKPEQD